MNRAAAARATVRLVLVALAVVAASCAARGTTARVTSLLGGPDAVSVISDRSGAVVREAFRVDGAGPLRPKDPGASGTVHGYPIVAGPVPLDDASAAVVADVLLDDATYLWDSAKHCEFAPGVALRATRGTTVVDVLVCFSCDEVEIWVDGAKRGHEDTDPRRADLVRVAKRLFPGDAAIRALE